MPKTFGQKIREERENKKWTLEQLAEAIGSTKSYIWELENKDSIRPSADKVQKLALAFGISVDYLLDDTGNIERSPAEMDKAFLANFND